MYAILRNGCHYSVEVHEITETDFVLSTDGDFLPATSFPEIRGAIEERRNDDGWKQILTLAAFGFLGYVIIDALSSPPPKRRKRRRCYNDEPLPTWKREYVRWRDKEICTYCGAVDRDGHADHRTSRFNGGSNHLNNLSWACRRCNLRKGPLNARQFRLLPDAG